MKLHKMMRYIMGDIDTQTATQATSSEASPNLSVA